MELFNLRQLESLDLSGGTAVGPWELGIFRAIFPGMGVASPRWITGGSQGALAKLQFGLDTWKKKWIRNDSKWFNVNIAS